MSTRRIDDHEGDGEEVVSLRKEILTVFIGIPLLGVAWVILLWLLSGLIY